MSVKEKGKRLDLTNLTDYVIDTSEFHVNCWDILLCDWLILKMFQVFETF